jgi:hypothetical protein
LRLDDNSLQLDLFHHQGIIEAIQLERAGMLKEGNWSGRDGVLTIDRSSGQHKYELWQ